MFWLIVRQSWRRNPRRRLLAVLTVFLAAGLKDVRAPSKHTTEMRDALKAAGHPAEEVIIEPNEMHGFYAEDAQFNLYTKMLDFFGSHIGGKATVGQPARAD